MTDKPKWPKRPKRPERKLCLVIGTSNELPCEMCDNCLITQTIANYDAYFTAMLKPLQKAKDYADKWKDTAVGFRTLADAVSKLLEESHEGRIV